MCWCLCSDDVIIIKNLTDRPTIREFLQLLTPFSDTPLSLLLFSRISRSIVYASCILHVALSLFFCVLMTIVYFIEFSIPLRSRW
jgi:hypothetical protein